MSCKLHKLSFGGRLAYLELRSTTSLGQQQQGGLSKIVDKHFDAAFNESVIEGELPHVRWGRIDYLNVTYITTKWNIWQYVARSHIYEI